MSNGTGNTINQVLTNSSNQIQTLTYSVTPITNGCSGPSLTSTVQVNPIPDLTISPISSSICSGETTAISLTSSVANASFSYIPTNSLAIIGEQAGSTNNITQLLSNSSSQLQNVVYAVTSTANGCSSNSSNIIVNVNPLPIVSAGNDTSLCGPSLFTLN
jgi:hypothetical protein